jgi:hypothetical protein
MTFCPLINLRIYLYFYFPMILNTQYSDYYGQTARGLIPGGGGNVAHQAETDNGTHLDCYAMVKKEGPIRGGKSTDP